MDDISPAGISAPERSGLLLVGRLIARFTAVCFVLVCLHATDALGVITITFENASYSFVEGAAESLVTVIARTDSPQSFEVSIGAQSESATNSDYTITTTKLVFESEDFKDSGLNDDYWVARKEIRLEIVDDNIPENDETFRVLLKADTGEDSISTVTIRDNDDLAFELSVTPALIIEGGLLPYDIPATATAGATVTVSLVSASLEGDHQIDLTFGGTANEATDYFVSSKTLTLSEGNREASATIRAWLDDVPEADETIIITATATREGGVPVSPQTVRIQDRSDVNVSFEKDTVVFGESDTSDQTEVVVVARSRQRFPSFWVVLSTVSKSAIYRQDFLPINNTYEFASSDFVQNENDEFVVRHVLKLQLLDDDVFEVNETFLVRLEQNAWFGAVGCFASDHSLDDHDRGRRPGRGDGDGAGGRPDSERGRDRDVRGSVDFGSIGGCDGDGDER